MTHHVMLSRLAYTRLQFLTGLGAGTQITPEPGFALDAFTWEEARRRVEERLGLYGEIVRSLSVTTDGAFLAMVYAKEAAPPLE